MINKFKQYIAQEGLFAPDEKILLAVSGGIDSMTLLDLCMKAGFNIGIAHCNFKLRDAESDGDQEFIQKFALQHHLEIFIKIFNTKQYADDHKISIQMAARDLRYHWFQKLAAENKFDKIAVAHNLNDVVETFFINLTRGTGIKGLTGIKPLLGNIARPLLFAKRKEIKQYAIEHHIVYREDSSNSETKYLRNSIRHKIIPEFEHLNPSFLESVMGTISILKSAENTWNQQIDKHRQELIVPKDGAFRIGISSLDALKISPAEMFELLQPFGFSFDAIQKILSGPQKQPGKLFYSSTHKLLIDREYLIISELTELDNEEYLIKKGTGFMNAPINLTFNELIIEPGFDITRNRSVATFDADKLVFPLKLRKWKQGDFFYPFGMKGKKKLSDYFTDQKISIIDKEKTWLLLSEENIIWIVNHRTDNRYKVDRSTKTVLQITFNQ